MSKVAAIDTAPDGVTYAKKGHDFDPYLTSFISSVPGAVASNWDKEKDTNSTLVIRGVGGTAQKAYRHCFETGRNFYAIDTGYFGNSKHKVWHRITNNALQNMGPIIQRPHNRLMGVNYAFKEFTPGRKILICPPSNKIMDLFDQPSPEEWVASTVEKLKEHTDRPIEIRMKPTRQERITTNTIQDALADDVHCLVTFNSIAATEALMEGKPAITLGPNSAQLICDTDLSKVENLHIPTNDEMLEFMAHLSYAQFTQHEMENGYAWSILQENK